MKSGGRPFVVIIFERSFMNNIKLREYIRTTDAMNRITLPKEILVSNRIPDCAQFFIKVIDNGILLVPKDLACCMCSNQDDLIMVDGTMFCKSCAGRVSLSLDRSVKS